VKSLYLLTFLLPGFAFSQSVSTQIGARPHGIAYASSTLFDTWSVFNNIAGIAKLEVATAACAYDAHPTLPGANRMAAVFAMPFKIGVAGTGIYRFGDDLYNEHILTAGFSNQFGLAALGAQLNYIQYRTEGFGNKGVWSLNFGGIAELTPHLFVGAYVININQPSISQEDKLPTKLVAGIGFKSTEKVFVATEIEKDLDYDPLWKMGLEYKFHPKFCGRTGYNINPNTAYFGFGFKTKKLTIDYALQHSHVLNLSHQASVAYQFASK
jgi:hypothetical protein